MSNKMWGGRFSAGPDKVMAEINASIDVDRKLFRQDIAASRAHARMLAKQGIISPQDAKKIAHGLDTILSEIEAGRFKFKRSLEDIHMNVEARLAELIGPAAGRLHTARSRNDQVATDFKLWVREAIAAAASVSMTKSRSDTASSELAIGRAKPSAFDVLSRSRSNEVPASAAAPSGDSLRRVRASASRPRSRAAIST